MRNRFVASGLIFLLASCATVSASPVLTPEAVYADSTRYDGQQVTVRGYLLLGTNARSLFQSEAHVRELRRLYAGGQSFDPRAYDSWCLSLSDSSLLWQHRDILSDRDVTITGVLDLHYGDDRLDLQACGPAAIIVGSDEIQRVVKTLEERE